MVAEQKNDDQAASKDAANIKLAIILGLVAFGIYAGFIWFTVK